MPYKTLLTWLVVVCCSIGLGWVTNGWRYETKLSEQETAHVKTLNSMRDVKDALFAKQKDLSERKENDYRKEIGELESKLELANTSDANLNSIIDRLRNQERNLYTRLNNLSCEATRKYAEQASTAHREVSEALRDEQQAHTITSGKADSYYLGWKALDEAWPNK